MKHYRITLPGGLVLFRHSIQGLFELLRGYAVGQCQVETLS